MLNISLVQPRCYWVISATGGPSATIKSHHNVGGLPEKMKLKVIEPLRKIFKDEVRKIGQSLVKKEIYNVIHFQVLG